MTTYDVKVWDPKKIGDTTKGRWRVRWAVTGREHCRSFAARPLADGFAAGLKDAIRDHRPFDEKTGLPAQPGCAAASRSWYDHARAYTEMKWPHLAATSRRSAAEALTTVTEALAPAAGAHPTRRSCAARCSPGRSTPAPATSPRLKPCCRAGLGRRRVPARHRAGRPGRHPRRARCVRPHLGRKAGRGHHPAAQARRVLQRARVRRRGGTAGG
jgi:hypothetical protein